MAHEADGLDEVDDALLPRPRALRDADRLRRRVPQLRQGVLRGARPRGADEPRRPHRPAYADLLVVENPATSSPGLAFLLATIEAFGEDGWEEWWSDLRDNGVEVVDGWEEAYYSSFSGGLGSEGDRPLVVSYASSPPAEVVFADPPVDEAPTGVSTPAATGRSRAPASSRGTDHADEAGPAHRLPALRDGAGRRAAVDVRVPRARRHRAARRCSWSTPPRPRRCSSSRPRTSTPTGRTGSTGGPTSCCGDAGPRRSAAPPGRPARVPRVLLRVAGRQHRRRGAARRARVGPRRCRRGARRSRAAPGRVVHAVAGARVHRC